MAWKFYVQSVGGKLIKANSSNKFDGVEIVLEKGPNSKVYDMTGTLGELGCETDALQNDRIMAVADMEGNLIAVYIYDRSNMLVEFQAYCEHCDMEVTWAEWSNEKQLPKDKNGGHFKLMKDIQLNGQQSLPADAKICLDLNGKTVNGKEGARVYSLHNQNCELAIMDTSEEKNGRLAAHGEVYAQGCVIWVRYGALYLYDGILDASDVVCTGRGGAAVYVPKERFFYMYGGEIIGGTAKYYYNEETGKYANGLGGAVYTVGKFVLYDGVIRDGVAQSKAIVKNGSTSYQRGIGGNIYVGSGGVFEMNGGTIKNGRGGSAGNIYLDGTAEFTMNGGSITGGSTKGSSGNIYLSGTMQMNGGTISGGRVLDAATGAVKENHSSANISAATGSHLELRGGTIRGGVAVRDGGVNDNKRTNLVLTGGPVVYSGTKGQPNLTIETGAEPVIVKVGNLTARAKIGITAQGIFSQKTSQTNQDNFISDISGADVLYVDECLAVGKLACLCGQTKHVGDCDGKEILWSPWLSTNSLPASSGSFFLVNDVTYTKTKALGGTKNFIDVDLDLNGKTITSGERAINVFGTLNLADHAGGGKIIGVGIDNKMDHTGVALVYTDSKMNIYGGTLKLADKHNKITNGGVMGIGAGAVVNLYAGTIDGRTTETENTVEKGGAVRVTGTMNVHGGTIYGGKATDGGAFFVEKSGQLNILSGTVNGGEATNGGSIYVTGEKAKLTVSGGVIQGGVAKEGGNIRVQGYANAEITGGMIMNGTATAKGGNISHLSGVITVKGGKIIDGKTLVGPTSYNKKNGVPTYGKGYGGNIITNATFVISGGTVSNGEANRGGNIYVDADGKLSISKGSVAGGRAEENGGNLYVSGGKLAISGGTIDKGSALNGGSIRIQGNGTVEMTGGIIQNGKANAGGNVSLYTGTFTMSDGQVLNGTATKNHGGNFAVASSVDAPADESKIEPEEPKPEETKPEETKEPVVVPDVVLTISGGTVSGGKTEADKGVGGNIRLSKANAVLNLSGGEISKGATPYRGGNVGGVGTVNMNGGSITGGSAVGGGGNIESTSSGGLTLNLSGGEIIGGLHNGEDDTDRTNIYMTNGSLNLSGKATVDGGVLLVNNVGCSVSGQPKVIGVTGIRLVGNGAPAPTISVGEMSENAKILVNAKAGVFAKPAENYTITNTDKGVFQPLDTTLSVGFEGVDLKLYVPHAHCWCENAEAVPADHTCDTGRIWTAVAKSGNSKTLNSGSYYLDWTGNAPKSLTIAENATVYLCLNGASIRATNTIKLSNGSVLYICDCSEGETGVVTTTTNSVVKIVEGQTLNLMSGTVDGTYVHNNAPAASRIAVEMSGGNFNMYGGKLANGCASVSTITDDTKKETETGKGGNLYIAGGTATILDGELTGGKLGDASCDVILKDGSLTVGGGTKIGVVMLAKDKTVTVSSEKPLTGTKVIGIALEEEPGAGESVAVVTGAASADAFHSINSNLKVLFENGTVKLEGDTSNLTEKELKYDDRKDVAQWLNLNERVTSVKITKQVPTSKKVGTDTLDANVLEYNDGTLYAVGTGTAVLTVNGQSYNVTVEPAKLSLFMITGTSIGVGQYGDGDKSVVVEAGQAYRANTYKLTDAELEAILDPNGGLGYGSATRAGATLDAYAPGQGGNLGEGSAVAWSWTQKTNEKVWVLNASKGGSAIIDWIPSSVDRGNDSYKWYDCHDDAVKLFKEAQQVLEREIAAGHYTLGDMSIIYHNGANFSDNNGLKDQFGQLTFTWEQLKDWYDIMWSSYQTNLNRDLDGDGNVDKITMGFSLYGSNLAYDQALSYYLGVTDPDMAMLSHSLAKWKEDLSTFPAPNYPVQDGSVVKAPESVNHTAQGGTSDNSLFCSHDNLHLSQTGYNAIGLEAADNLYGMLRGDRTVTGMSIVNSQKEPAETVTLRVGQTWRFGAIPTPLYGGGVTFEAAGAISQDTTNGWIICADSTGDGKLTIKTGSTVLKEVNFTVVDAHQHCFCAGAEVVPTGHSCDSTIKWTPVVKRGASKTNMTDGGHYFLDWTGSSAQSLIVASNAEVYLCLNGATIRATQAITLSSNSALHICDCSQDETGVITVSGESETAVILMDGYTRTVNLYGGTISGTYNQKKLQSVRMSGGTPTFNMYGGTISGGYVADTDEMGGNVRLSGGNARFNMYGGEIIGGETGFNGGNVFVSRGQFTMTGGKITEGKDAGKGGNVYMNPANATATPVVTITGGEITGGTADTNGCIHMEGGTLNLGGNPRITKIGLTAGQLITVKDGLAATTPIGIEMAEAGKFAQGDTGVTLTTSHASSFTSVDMQYAVALDSSANGLILAGSRCLCNGTGKSWCDHTMEVYLPWDGKTALTESGNYYLTEPVQDISTMELAADSGLSIKLDLAGNSIQAKTRFFQLGRGTSLTVANSSANAASVIGKGAGNNGSGGVFNVNNAQLNLYNVTAKLAATHNAIKDGGVIVIGNASSVVNIVDSFIGSTESYTGTVENGGSIRIGNGQLNIKDSQIYGHDVTGVGRSVCVKGGTVTLDGWVYVNNIYLKTGTNPIVVKDTLDIDKTLDNTVSAVGIDMEAGTGLFAVAESGKKLTYEMKSAFPYDRVALTEQGFELVGEDVPLGCLCGKTDGTHEAGCDKMDPKPWGETDSLPDSGNYYLTQNVELTAVKEIQSHLKLWLQGKNVTVKTGTTLDNLIKITNTGKLELLDSTQNPGTVDGLITDAEDATKVGEITKNIIYMDGTLVLDGANLSGEGLTTVENGLVICVNSGNFTMKSGSIVGGTVSNKFGGAIYANGTATIRIEGGTITGGIAKQGGNIFSRGTVEITGGSVTDGAYTDKGGNIYMTGGSLSITGVSGQATDIVSGGYKSTDATRTLTDRANIVCWDSNISLTDVTLEGGVWVTGNKTCTLSGKVIVNGDGVGLTIGATTNGGNTAQVVIGNNFDTTSTVDLAIATWAAKAGKIYASGLTQAQADVFTVHTANVTKRQETDKDTWEIVYP